MLTVEESVSLLSINQRLRVLHIRKAEAQQCGNQAHADKLQAEINGLTLRCDKLIDATEAI